MKLFAFGAALTATVLGGCSSPAPAPAPRGEQPGGSNTAHSEPAGMDMMTPSAGDSEATRGYKEAMAEAMQMPPFTGDADRDFMVQMRVHHQAAVQMSEVLLRHGNDKETRKLAEEIIAAQKREIAQIDAWLNRKR